MAGQPWPPLSHTFLQVFFQPPASCVQLLLRQGEGPFPRQLWKSEVGKLPLQVLMKDDKFSVTLGAQLPPGHVHVVDLQGANHTHRLFQRLELKAT